MVVVFCVFAITGFSTAWLSRSVTSWIGIDEETHWSARLSLRLAVLLFGYQAVLLLVAFIFGQFSFFWRFEKSLLRHLGLIKAEKTSSTNKSFVPHEK